MNESESVTLKHLKNEIMAHILGASEITADEQLEKLRMFHVEHLRFSKALNLFSAKDREFILSKHIYDGAIGSIIVLRSLGASFRGRLIDWGSGNGVPGVVLGVLAPWISVILVERDLRKATFLDHVVQTLKLTNIQVFPGEICAVKYWPRDEIFSRGLGSVKQHLLFVSQIAELQATDCVPQRLWMWKGPGVSEEVSEARALCSTWNIQDSKKYVIPGYPEHREILSVRFLQAPQLS